jgi:hypothetical protein
VMPTALGLCRIDFSRDYRRDCLPGEVPGPRATEENAAATELSLKTYSAEGCYRHRSDAAANTTLYAGTLKKGEEVPLTNKGAIRLQYSDGTRSKSNGMDGLPQPVRRAQANALSSSQSFSAGPYWAFLTLSPFGPTSTTSTRTPTSSGS